RRVFGRFLVDQGDRFLGGQRLGLLVARQSRVGRAVGDVGTVTAGHQLHFAARSRVRAESLERLDRLALAPAPAVGGIGELGDGGVHAGFEDFGGRAQLGVLAVVCEVGAVAADAGG